MVTHDQLKEAKDYVNYWIKEGVFNIEDWENLSDDEFVARAIYHRNNADLYSEFREKGED